MLLEQLIQVLVPGHYLQPAFGVLVFSWLSGTFDGFAQIRVGGTKLVVGHFIS